MYGAMREHAPGSTRIAGVSAALVMTAAVGYALANGFIGHVAKFIESPLTFTPLAEEKALLEEKKELFETDSTMPREPVVLTIPDNPWVAEDDRDGISVPPGGPGPRPGVGTGGGTSVAASPIHTRPSLITRTPPPYPSADIRKQNEGVTGIKVCLDASGRVTSADISSSSGHTTLDHAALKWVRNARFTPAESDGVAQSICGHDVFYEWKLKDAR